VTVGGGDHEDDLARLVRGLTESAWALAALAAALQKDDPHVILEDRQDRVLGVLGLAAPAVGGWRLNPAAASVATSGGGAYAARFIATLRWAAAAAEGRLDWAEQDLGTKAALGRGSSLAGRVLVRVLAPRLGDLAERLAAPGGVALDVGTGVGEVAVALAQAAPALRVVGIDVLDDVLAEARTRVVEHGLADRIVLRRQDVMTLADVEVFDLAYLPAYFVPEDAVVAALPLIRAALRPGGWIFVPVREGSGTELAGAITRWHHPGCAVWNVQETESRLVESGFGDVHSIVVSPLAPTIVVGARAAAGGGC
jgi:protein-L-isoaspartate O-methyltransferase